LIDIFSDKIANDQIRQLAFELLKVIGDLEGQLFCIGIGYRYCPLAASIGYVGQVEGSAVWNTYDQWYGSLQVGRPALFIDRSQGSGTLSIRQKAAQRK
jgi:hypothetical protein